MCPSPVPRRLKELRAVVIRSATHTRYLRVKRGRSFSIFLVSALFYNAILGRGAWGLLKMHRMNDEYIFWFPFLRTPLCHPFSAPAFDYTDVKNSYTGHHLALGQRGGWKNERPEGVRAQKWEINLSAKTTMMFLTRIFYIR